MGGNISQTGEGVTPPTFLAVCYVCRRIVRADRRFYAAVTNARGRGGGGTSEARSEHPPRVRRGRDKGQRRWVVLCPAFPQSESLMTAGVNEGCRRRASGTFITHLHTRANELFSSWPLFLALHTCIYISVAITLISWKNVQVTCYLLVVREG